MHVKRCRNEHAGLAGWLPAICLVLLAGILLEGGTAARAAPPDITLEAPPALQESGLLRHLLPRFRFKTRIRVGLTEPGGAADMALTPVPPGVPVFSGKADGTVWHLRLPPEGADARPRAEAFLEWLQSKPGRAAIAAFPPGGAPLFEPAPEQAGIVEERRFAGDPARGYELARRHCMRCHVVDEQNPFAGIGSTPSFAAMRSFEDWEDTFAAFWAANPHRAVVTVEEMSEDKDPARPLHVAPVLLSQRDLDDLLAYVATIAPKDLGPPIRMR